MDAEEKPVSATAVDPKPTTSMRSSGFLVAMKARAAAMASASGCPAMDCDRSMARTTLRFLPRFSACSPETSLPFSRTTGAFAAGVAVTTTARTVG